MLKARTLHQHKCRSLFYKILGSNFKIYTRLHFYNLIIMQKYLNMDFTSSKLSKKHFLSLLIQDLVVWGKINPLVDKCWFAYSLKC